MLMKRLVRSQNAIYSTYWWAKVRTTLTERRKKGHQHLSDQAKKQQQLQRQNNNNEQTNNNNNKQTIKQNKLKKKQKKPKNKHSVCAQRGSKNHFAFVCFLYDYNQTYYLLLYLNCTYDMLHKIGNLQLCKNHTK